jgi:hypothetical protein
LNTLGLIILSALGALILFGSRRWALLGLLAGCLYLTQTLALNVAGFSLYPMRVLLVIALLRIVLRRELLSFSPNRLDLFLVVLYVYAVGVFLLRSNEDQVYQIGTAVDALLSYFVFRSMIRAVEDVRWVLLALVVLLLPYAVLVWIESTTYRNPLAVVGGVENARAGDMWFRGGRLRATGGFGHPSLLGTFAATFLALYIGLWFTRSYRAIAAIGGALCLAIVGASNSGAPAMCVATAIVGWLLWPLRTDMRLVRAGLVVMFVLLALSMKAPVWYVLAKISSLTGGDGWHRGALLDVAFKNLDRWWLAGMPLRETAGWLPYTNSTTGYVDMTNTFLQFGVNSGLGAVVLLIATLTVAFSRLGRAMRVLRFRPTAVRGVEQFYWGLGVVLAIHTLNWFSITYWDQTYFVFFLQLAMLSSLSDAVLRYSKERPSIVDRAESGNEHVRVLQPSQKRGSSGDRPRSRPGLDLPVPPSAMDTSIRRGKW